MNIDKTTGNIEINDTAYYIDLLENKFKSVFTEKMTFEPSTPQAQLICILASCFADLDKKMLGFYNTFDLKQANGDLLDSTGFLYNLHRKKATYCEPSCNFYCSQNTSFSKGSIFQVISESVYKGALFELTEDLNIKTPISTAKLKAKNPGLISISPQDSLAPISYNPYIISINATEDFTSQDIESDEQFYKRILSCYYANSSGTAESIKSKLLNLDYITEVNVLDKNQNENIQDYGMVQIIVNTNKDLNDDEKQDVAQIIYSKLPLAVLTYPSDEKDPSRMSSVVVDTFGNKNTIYFYKGQSTPFYVEMKLKVKPGFDKMTNLEDLVKQALQNKFMDQSLGQTLYFSDCLFAITQVLNTASCYSDSIQWTIQGDYSQLTTKDILCNNTTVGVFGGLKILE